VFKEMNPIRGLYRIGVYSVRNKNNVVAIGIVKICQVFGDHFSVLVPSKDYVFIYLGDNKTIKKVIISKGIGNLVNCFTLERSVF